ncbi:site-specific DNA-methyltransferase [Xanthomonas euvesicatoria pv. physalidis]|uniref:DNA-methyltransferase n=1 Tax=Xanthomonas euvesicatoria TaxID=456327 RepID=UPI001C461D88|nr:site-specific DNA-methyltransferase [Xanthomonas euvesicatoria]MBV6687311.1 site-specific DNA-methyltransferase [Xanthomonas euvesicatoria pv. physalidis]
MTSFQRIHVGDCLSILPTLAEASVDAIVTDPPYGLSFMGKRWDYDVPSTAIWAECLRVLKPGGHLLAFAGTRTQHRMAVRIEDAGFEIRDMIAWVYGSGFPKSHNGEWGGTALKPALEPITMARKPLLGTVAANHALHGTGALNINACRVSAEKMPPNTGAGGMPRRNTDEQRGPGTVTQPHDLGRWPANVVHDGSEEVLAAFPDAPGQLANASTNSDQRKTQNTYGAMRRGRGDEPSADSENAGQVGFRMRPGMRRLDEGSAARFFYCAKASKADRDGGLESLEAKPHALSGGSCAAIASGTELDRTHSLGLNRVKDRRNNHPTVKPTDLMRYLCRLVTPAGGTVLDPFMGSGSTGKAAALEGFTFVGIEMDPAYAAIAEARIAAAIEAAAREAALPRQIGLPLGDVA